MKNKSILNDKELLRLIKAVKNATINEERQIITNTMLVYIFTKMAEAIDNLQAQIEQNERKNCQ